MKILFLCIANSARSQMAEGWAREIFGESAEIQSVGTKPCGYLHPWAIKAMEEVGVDIKSQHSKSIADLPASFLHNVDIAITLCSDDVLPADLKPSRLMHWPFPDPAADPEDSKPEAFHLIRDKIEKRLRAFAQEVRA